MTCAQPPLVPHSWGKRSTEAGGHPQTLGRDESLHSLRISDLGIGDTVKELFAPTYS